MLFHLRRHGRTFGVDMDYEAAGYCRERGLTTIAQASAAALPYAAETFDLVTMLDVLEHIPDDAGALAEAMRVLRPGGLLMLAVPAYRFLWGAQDEVSRHVRRYTVPELGARMKAANFAVRRLTYFNTALFPPIAALRLLRRFIPATRSDESDFHAPAPGPINALLAAIFGSEAALVARHDLPFGVSILGLAEKRASVADAARAKSLVSSAD